jgi:ATP-dependent helicase Lhr and Lhr-like helicase
MLKQTRGYELVREWLDSKGFQPFNFQEETWQHILNNKSGLVNATTGYGKTFSIFPGAVIRYINQDSGNKKITWAGLQ